MKKSLLLPLVILCLCMVLVVGGTYALFTDKVEMSNHLRAGNLEIGLERISYKERTLDANGFMTTPDADTDPVDLVTNNTKLFEINGPIVPTAYYESILKITNKGSVAFDYGVRIINLDESERAIAEQIRIDISTVTGDTPTLVKSFMLVELLDAQDPSTLDASLGYMIAGTPNPTATFVVKAEFVDDTDKTFDNDTVKNAEINFDVQVYATQKTNAPA